MGLVFHPDILARGGVEFWECEGGVCVAGEIPPNGMLTCTPEISPPPKWNTGNITEDWYSMGKRETYIVCLTIGSYP